MTTQMLKPEYNLDPYFDLLIAGFVSPEKKAKRGFPCIEEAIVHYKQSLKRLEAEPWTVSSLKTYMQQFIVPGGGMYEIHWDVQSIQKLIVKNQRNLEFQQLPVAEIIKYVDVKSLDETRVGSTKLDFKSPILVAPYPPLNTWRVLDGNHRIMTKWKQDINSTVFGCILEEDIHMQGMCSDFHRAIYKVHDNLAYISEYMDGNIDYDQVLQSLWEV